MSDRIGSEGCYTGSGFLPFGLSSPSQERAANREAGRNIVMVQRNSPTVDRS
jgi:hypothetical protein